MLAYVFWHWHNPQINTEAYQEYLKSFHQTLSEHKPEGFHYSRVLEMAQFPWLERTEETYEDWYIVENSAALDPLNHAAVRGVRLEPHDRVARWTEGGTAALYRLHFGSADIRGSHGQEGASLHGQGRAAAPTILRLPLVRFAYRFSKPTGMSYAVLYDLLRPLEEQNAGDLWIRHMTLGPGPEFCFHSSDEVALPESLQALKIPVQQIYVSPQKSIG